MKQPDSLDIGAQTDLAKYRLRVAKEGVAFKRHRGTIGYFIKNSYRNEGQ